MVHQCNILKNFILFILICSLFFLTSCSAIVSSAMSGMMNNLSLAILNNNDLKMVKTGAPAYLLMIDSLVMQDSDNEDILISAALLYTAYADTFVQDKIRVRKMADKALGYASKALCLSSKGACSLQSLEYEKFKNVISAINIKDIAALYTLGCSWASWIKANSNDFNAIADLPRIEIIMHHVIELDETYKDGSAYLYLATLATLLPPALGGQPEKGRDYFEKAIKISKGKNFMIKVLYAKQYARMLFDRDLHDKLLEEVLKQNPEIQGYTLVNTYAQVQAKKLLESADEYF